MRLRMTYTMIEDSLMIDIVIKHINVYPGKLSFWVKAKNTYEGLERHSPASLKEHWREIVKKGKAPYFKENKFDKKTWMKVKEVVEGEGRLKEWVGKREIIDDELVKKEEECEEFVVDGLGNEDISVLFGYLVERCSAVAGFNVNPELVFWVLDMHGGSVKKTIQNFEQKSQIIYN